MQSCNFHTSLKINEKGFTLTELIVVMGILTILLSFVTLNLVNIQQKTSQRSTLDVLIADIKDQQNKAMAGGTKSGQNTDYGIYFEANRYILFQGSSYVSGDSSNFAVNLDSGLTFTNILFPSSQIVFQRVSGEVIGFTSGQNTVTLTNSSNNDQKTIQINRYGVITAVN